MSRYPTLVGTARQAERTTSKGSAMFAQVAGLIVDFLVAEGPLAGRVAVVAGLDPALSCLVLHPVKT